MSVPKDLTNQRFGKLIACCRVENSKNGKARWLCKCDCGKETVVVSTDLIKGHTMSCGCKKFESHNKKHGMKHTRIYDLWCEMKGRCYTKTSAAYKDYGAKGITVCDEWKSSFVQFMKWAFANGYKDGLSIDRIDNAKGYSPENCRWVTQKQQVRNRSITVMVSYKGEKRPLAEWCSMLGVDYHLVYSRYFKFGYTFEEAISMPKHSKRKTFQKKNP